MSDPAIEVGQAAPNFTLPDQNENPVSLGDLRGEWVVIYFYPKDDTPGCTKEACQFTEGIKSFQKLNARVLGVSPDDAASHQKFIKKYKLKVDLLSDPDHSMMAAYEAWGTKKMYGKEVVGVKRSTVIVNPEGQIAYHWKSVRADGHAAKVQEKLTELQG